MLAYYKVLDIADTDWGQGSYCTLAAEDNRLESGRVAWSDRFAAGSFAVHSPDRSRIDFAQQPTTMKTLSLQAKLPELLRVVAYGPSLQSTFYLVSVRAPTNFLQASR